jgi:hypothetical protein
LTKIVKNFIDAMRPKGRVGRLPKITPCPYCGAHLSQTDHGKHRATCAAAFRDALPQAAEFAQDPGGGYNRDGTFPQT